MNAAAAGYPPGGSPYAYVPVDPFKPSIAFSLRNIFRRSAEPDVEAADPLHSPPQPQPSRHDVELETSLYKLRRKKVRGSQQVQESPWSLAPDIDMPPQPHAAPTLRSAVRRSASSHGSALKMADERVRSEAWREELASAVIVREALDTSRESQVSQAAQPISFEPQTGVEATPENLALSAPLDPPHSVNEPHANPPSRTIPTLEQIQARMRNTHMRSTMSTSQGEMTPTWPPPSQARLSRVCRRCKSLKVRCEYSPELNGICDRCHKGGHECVIEGRKARRAPALNPPSRTIPTLEQIQAEMWNTPMLSSSSTSQGEMTLTGSPPSQARPSHACQRCKNLKVRCEYPPELNGICDRCHRGGHECVMPERKIRRAPPLRASSASSVSTAGSAVGSLTSLPQSTVGVGSGDSPEPDDVALPGPVPLQQAQGSAEASSDSLSHFNDLFYVPHPASAPPQPLSNPSIHLRSAEYGPSSESRPDYRLEAQTLTGTQVETSTGGTDDQVAPGDRTVAHLPLQNQTESVATAASSQPLSACRRCKILKLDCQYPAGLLGKCLHCQSSRHECVILSGPIKNATFVPMIGTHVMDYNFQPSSPAEADEPSVPDNRHVDAAFRRGLQRPAFDDRPSPEAEIYSDDMHTSKVSPPPRRALPVTSDSRQVPIARLSLSDLPHFGAARVYRTAGTDSFTSSPFRTDSHIDAPSKAHSTPDYILAFLLDTVPRQIYLHLLLRLPYLYYSRVTRIFEEAEMSMPMIKQGILDAAKAKSELQRDAGMGTWTRGGLQATSRPYLPMEFWEPQLENAAYLNLQNTWHTFVDSLQKEWKTLNIISVLLLTAILTILQIPSAAADPVTRYTAVLSMICALMSLLYGCIYIIRFGTMRKTYKGAEWAQEAQKSRTGIFWNVWVLLAMPATWLSWSMVMYIVTIMSFVWRTTPISQPSTTDESPVQVLIPRLIISLAVTLGVVYFFLIATTLRKYGELMDRAWQTRIWGWMQDGNFGDLEKGRPEEAESFYEVQKPDGRKFGGPINSFSKNDLNQRDVPQSSGSPIPKDVDQSHGVSMATIIDAKAAPSSALGSATVEVRPDDTDAGALFSTFNWQQTFVLPRASETRFNEDNVADFKTHEGSHTLNTAFGVSHSSSNQGSQSRDSNSDGTASLALAAGATTFKSPATRPVRLFGFSEIENLTSYLYHIASVDDPNLENISGLEWETFRKDVLKIIASSTSDETGQLDLSLLTPVLHDFNQTLRMHGSNGRVSVSREAADKGTDAYDNYAVYYLSSSSEQSIS